MSCWTHVAAIVRVDGFASDDKTVEEEKLMFADVFGRECLWKDSRDVWQNALEHPEQCLPMGSEGSLMMDVWINPRPNHADRYTISIFGDLRDVWSSSWIIKWFKDKLKSLYVRQATITVDCECDEKPISWTYGEDDA